MVVWNNVDIEGMFVQENNWAMESGKWAGMVEQYDLRTVSTKVRRLG